MEGVWRKELMMFALVVALAVGLGWTIGHPWFSVGLFLLAWTLRHQIHLYRIQRWVGSRRHSAPPRTAGVCGGVIDFVLEVERTNRKHKRKLDRLLKGFQEAMAALPDAAVVLDKQGRAEWWNSEAVRLLGLPLAPGGASPPIVEILPVQEFAGYLEARDFGADLDLLSPVDPQVRLSVRVVPFGRGKRMLMQVRDITRISQLEEIRRDFVANTSHELRNPLTVILGYLEAMHEAEDLRAWARPIGQMHQQATRIRGIVEDMLTLSTLESTEHPDGECQDIDVAALLRTLKDEAEIFGAEKLHQISLEVAPGSTLQANCDEIRSAFSNLLSNAVRYTPANGSIRLRWWTDRAGGHFSVSDNGIGIDSTHIPRLTERFYRVDTARSRETGGTGLGLAIVKHALSRAGGHLSIESEPGVGSTFTCHFPSRRIDGALAAASDPASEPAYGNVVPFRGLVPPS